MLLQPNAQQKTEQNSVQFIMHWTGDDLTVVTGSSQLRRHTQVNQPVNHETKTDDEIVDCLPGLDCHEPVTAVAARRWFNAQRKTEFNWTAQYGTVEFNVPLDTL